MRASQKTRQLIAFTGLALFNEHGERSVSTNHIAAAADMSPGNLYYHFSNKQEIVALLFSDYQAQVKRALTLDPLSDQGMPGLRNCVEGVIAAIWDYRFIYRDLEHLLQADQELALQHRAFSAACLREGRKLLEALCNCQILVMTGQEQQTVAINAWLILTSWVRYLQTTLPGPARLTVPAVRRGAWQALSLLQGFVTPTARPAFAELMLSFRGVDQPERPGPPVALAAGT